MPVAGVAAHLRAHQNPRDYAARVRRMSSTDVDSTLAANLPVLDDSALHADFTNMIGPLENGRVIADTCDVHEESDDEDGGAASGRPPARAARQRRRRARHRRRGRRQSISSRRQRNAKRRKPLRLGRLNGPRSLETSTSTSSSQTQNGRARAATRAKKTTSARVHALSSSRSAARAQTFLTTSPTASSPSSSDGAEGHPRRRQPEGQQLRSTSLSTPKPS